MRVLRFEPGLFAHGRVLWRHPGSEGARFSPRLAHAMVSQAAQGVPPGTWLWDPFCGTGLIPSLAVLFARPPFAAVLASDLDPDCARTAGRNLALVSEVAAAQERLRQVQGFMGRNAKSEARWAEVSRYLESLVPAIRTVEREARPVEARCAAAEPGLLDGRAAAIVSDAPYGRATELRGELIPIVSAWLQSSVVWIDLACTVEQAQYVCGELPELRWHRARGGRARIRWEARSRGDTLPGRSSPKTRD